MPEHDPAPARPGPRQLMVVGSADSQLRPAIHWARGCATPDTAITVAVHPGRAMAQPRQLADLGVTQWAERPLRDLAADPALAAVDALFVVLTGSEIHAFLSVLRQAPHWATARTRPVVVTGYGGVVYEKHLEGLVWRIGADLIAVNCAADMAMLTPMMQGLGADPGTLVAAGYAAIAGPDDDRRAAARAPAGAHPPSPGARHPPSPGAPRRLLFATQDVVPFEREERQHLADQLVALARARPDWQVVIKPRNRPGEQTFHRERHPYPALLEGLAPLPPNLTFAYGPLRPMLAEADLLVTVSSTAAVEALTAGVPAAILTDVGLREGLGNHFFLGSGLLTTLPALAAGHLPVLDQAWARLALWSPGFGVAQLRAALEARWQAQATAGRALPFAPLWYRAETAPFILERAERAGVILDPPLRGPWQRRWRRLRRGLRRRLGLD